MDRAENLRASPPLFASPRLDRFTRVHPATPVVIYLPATVVLLALAGRQLGAAATVPLAAAGYLAWTLTEYWGHRCVFHFRPRRPTGARVHWLVHGVHHDHPNDPRRLVLPPGASLPLLGGFGGLCWLLLGGAAWLAVTGGFVAGYLAYDLLHFYLHHGRPRRRLPRWLRRWHLRHHFADAGSGFGISAPYWDLVFGTARSGRRPAGRRPGRAPTSSTARRSP